MNEILQEIFTLSEIDQLWGKAAGTAKVYLHRGIFNNDEIRKSANTWLVTKAEAIRVFGTIPEPEEDRSE